VSLLPCIELCSSTAVISTTVLNFYRSYSILIADDAATVAFLFFPYRDCKGAVMPNGDSVILLNPVDVGVSIPKLEHPCTGAVVCTKVAGGVKFATSNVPPFGHAFESFFSTHALAKAINQGVSGVVEIEDNKNSISYVIRRRVANQLFLFAIGVPRKTRRRSA